MIYFSLSNHSHIVEMSAQMVIHAGYNEFMRVKGVAVDRKTLRGPRKQQGRSARFLCLWCFRSG